MMYLLLACALLIVGLAPYRRLGLEGTSADNAELFGSTGCTKGDHWARSGGAVPSACGVFERRFRRLMKLWPRDGPGRRRKESSSGSVEAVADIELLAACLSAGLPTGEAVKAVAAVSQPQLATVWNQVSVMLDMGIPTHRAWKPIRSVEGLTDLADLAELSTQSGAVMAQGCRRLARQMTEHLKDAATARAERAGVLIAIPLATCFLPAFFVLGLVPVIVSLGSQLF